MRAFIKTIGIICTLGIIFAAIVISIIVLNRLNCESFRKVSELDVRTTLFNCYFKTNKGLIEVDRYQLELIYR